MILFLNKCDILTAKLRSGIKLVDYDALYGDRPNDFEFVSQYLRNKFAAVLRHHLSYPKPFFSHLMSVTVNLLIPFFGPFGVTFPRQCSC
jgi:hypothetical protein